MKESMFAAVAAFALSGCVVIGSREKYEYDLGSDVAEGTFTTEIKFDHSASRTILPFLRIDHERPPYDLVLSFYEPAGAESFALVVIDQLKIEFEDGGVVELLSLETSEPLRTFKVTHELANGHITSAHRFPDAIKGNASFTVTAHGMSVRTTGQQIPFRKVVAYRYDGREWTCWTTLHELLGV